MDELLVSKSGGCPRAAFLYRWVCRDGPEKQGGRESKGSWVFSPLPTHAFLGKQPTLPFQSPDE